MTNIAAMAGVAFIASLAGMRLVYRPSPAPESRPTRGLDPASPGRVLTPDGTRPGTFHGPDAAPEPLVYRQQWGTHAHIVEFVRWMRDWGFTSRYAVAEIVDYYAWFAADMRVEPLGASVFLTALSGDAGKALGVAKERARIKDPKTGKVPRLSSGTPERTRYYTIGETPQVRLPGGIAATRRRQAAPPRESRISVPGPDAILAGHETEPERIAA